MKKFLVMAMVAFAFLACNEGASVPKADKTALKTVTSKAFDLIGADAAKVDKVLKDAGYYKVEGGEMGKIVARSLARVSKSAKDIAEEQVMYIYNLPENYQTMGQKESTEYVKKILAKGECLYVAEVWFLDGELFSLTTEVIAPQKDNINLLFTEMSDAQYKNMPKGVEIEGEEEKFWEGFIESRDEEGNKHFENHADFVAAIAKAKAVFAGEYASVITKIDSETGGTEGFMYQNNWANPTEEEAVRMEEEYGFVAATGSFGVGSRNHIW